jgi:hypothetical protein
MKSLEAQLKTQARAKGIGIFQDLATGQKLLFQLSRIIRGSHGNRHQKPATYGIAHRSIEIRNSSDQTLTHWQGRIQRGAPELPYAKKLNRLPSKCEVIMGGGGGLVN